MTPSVHRAKRVTAAVRAVELLSLPLPSSIFPPRSLCLPTYPRPDADTVLTSSIVGDGDLQFETNPPRGMRGLAEPVERCPVVPALFLWQMLRPRRRDLENGRSFSSREREKNGGKPHVFPNIIFSRTYFNFITEY